MLLYFMKKASIPQITGGTEAFSFMLFLLSGGTI